MPVAYPFITIAICNSADHLQDLDGPGRHSGRFLLFLSPLMLPVLGHEDRESSTRWCLSRAYAWPSLRPGRMPPLMSEYCQAGAACAGRVTADGGDKMRIYIIKGEDPGSCRQGGSGCTPRQAKMCVSRGVGLTHTTRRSRA
jgi:hypothetical protein